jgi:L-arabinose 1-dehydrogenase [NAD(P)+]
MARIAVTGAAGNVGRQALEAFEVTDDEIVPLTHREHEDIESRVVDVTDRPAFVDALADADVLLHLAANPSPAAEWDEVESLNVGGAYNAFEAAVSAGLDRVVFASSNHAVGGYNLANPSNPETALTDGIQVVTPDDPPNPDSYYGVTKVLGEALGSYYATRHDLEVVTLRIGWLLDAEELRDLQRESPEPKARFARAIWLSPRDCRHALRRAVVASLPESAVTVHVTSRNDEQYLSLTEAATQLAYYPRDNAGEVLEAEGAIGERRPKE